VSQGTMTSPITESKIDQGIQTNSDLLIQFSDQGVQVKPTLTVETVNLEPSIFNSPSVLRNVDLSEFGYIHVPVTSQSVQATPDLNDKGVQTLISNLNQGLEGIDNVDLRVSADILEFGTDNIHTSPITTELIDNSVQTLVQYVDQGVQTNSDLIIPVVNH
jgi:hypothetical protein